MGYRSDVAYVIRFEDVESLKKFVGIHAINEGTKEALNECALFLGSSDDRPELHFLSEDTKWYESFDSVQAHEALLEFIDDGNGVDAGYKFIRIGEEDDDIEQRYGGDDDLIPWGAIGLNRYVAWDVGVTVKKNDKNTVAIVSEV